MTSQVYKFSVVIRFDQEPDFKEVAPKIKGLFDNWPCQDYIFQFEKASKWHAQCFIKLKDKTRPATLQKAMTENVKGFARNCGVKPCSHAGTHALKSYCMKKDDTFRDGPYTKRVHYTGKDCAFILTNPFPWQNFVLEIISKKPHDRDVYGLYNKTGNIGKTRLFKILAFKGQAELIPLGTATQMKTCVIAKANESGPCGCYIVDMPRTLGKAEHQQDIYSAIEAVKAGWVESAMYGKVQKLFMDPPHVFVISNHPFKTKYLSRDMWKIYDIEDKNSTPILKNDPNDPKNI